MILLLVNFFCTLYPVFSLFIFIISLYYVYLIAKTGGDILEVHKSKEQISPITNKRHGSKTYKGNKPSLDTNGLVHGLSGRGISILAQRRFIDYIDQPISQA